jgi:hypothetical protein
VKKIMNNVYDKIYSKKELQELNYQLKENEFIVEITEDEFMIEFEGKYDMYHIYGEAEEKITKYFKFIFNEQGLSEEEIKMKFKAMRESQEIFGIETALIEKYNPEYNISVRLPELTEQIINEITQNKILIMLRIHYMSYQLDAMDGEHKEYTFSEKDKIVLNEFYKTHKKFIDNHIIDNDFSIHFEQLFNRHLMCKLLSDIVI